MMNESNTMMNESKTMMKKFRDEYIFIEGYAMENGLIFKLIGDKLYVVSDIAYWKIAYLREWDEFALYHGNTMPTDLNVLKYEDADYHFQKDAKLSRSIMRLMIYIRRHDDYRAHLIENVENMPRRTKKQKNKYAAMKRREERYNTARVLQLINAVGMASERRLAVSA